MFKSRELDKLIRGLGGCPSCEERIQAASTVDEFDQGGYGEDRDSLLRTFSSKLKWIDNIVLFSESADIQRAPRNEIQEIRDELNKTLTTMVLSSIQKSKADKALRTFDDFLSNTPGPLPPSFESGMPTRPLPPSFESGMPTRPERYRGEFTGVQGKSSSDLSY